MTFQAWEIISAVTLAFTIPVLTFSYYNVVLFFSALTYPRDLAKWSLPTLDHFPKVSVLIAVYNEKLVIEKTLDALSETDYPKEKLEIILADDSTDETIDIINHKATELNDSGITTKIVRRGVRENYKPGALNEAKKMISGDYLLLLDADTIVPRDALRTGVGILQQSPVSFVSFRVGHYNRYQNFVTRLFSLSLDMGDTLNKMGSYKINAPFSFQGGFTLITHDCLSKVGYWAPDTITEDADVSCKLYNSGMRGIYLSNVRLMSEDPPTLEVWKKQTARVAQGWAKCARKYWKEILFQSNLSIPKRIALLLIFVSPFSSLTWIIGSFLSATAIILGLSAPSNSVFANPFYILLVTIPVLFFFASAGFALYVQKILTIQNVAFIPMLFYIGACMVTANSVGFISGLFGKTGTFFRTPKLGQTHTGVPDTEYFRTIPLDKNAVAELVLSAIALILSVLVAFQGVWFLALSLFGFCVLTLLSMNLVHRLRSSPDTIPNDKVAMTNQVVSN